MEPTLVAAEETSPESQPLWYQRYLDLTQHHTSRVWDHANRLSRNYISYLAKAIINFVLNGRNEAVAFGYWTLFSLFPLVILVIVIASNTLGARNAKSEVYRALNTFLPGSGSSLIEENINLVPIRRDWTSLIGLGALLFGASRLFNNLQTTLSRIFRDERRRLWPIQFVVGWLMLLTLIILAAMSVSLSAMFRLMGNHWIGERGLLVGISSIVVPLFITTTIFTLLFRFIPRRKIRWSAIVGASILAAVAWELVKYVFSWYVEHLANLGLMYGSLGAVIGLLTWTYFTGCLIYLCAEIAVATDDWMTARAAVPLIQAEPLPQS